jgi:GTP-binding protein
LPDPSLAPFADLPIEFVGSFPDPNHPLDPPHAEIACLGRSNVGKSSLLNALTGRKIAKTSATPGKTQLLNVFRFPGFYLLDLPGYGFARASQSDRRRFRTLIENTIRLRPNLLAAVWLLDVRHPPSGDDLTMRELLSRSRRAIIPVLTKGDKLSRAQALAARRERARELGLDADDLILTSSREGTGFDRLAERIRAVLVPEAS